MSPDLLKQTVEKLLSLLGIEATVSVVAGHPASPEMPSRSGRTVVAVVSADSTLLIGPGGEHLRSLNTIARRLVEAAHGEEAANFSIDINGYHEAQMERVRANARMLAQRARLFKHDVELPAMSPYERLVVHELFAEDPEIETHSEGEGKFRHIVLKYK